MYMGGLIVKKRNGDALTKEEIEFMINGYVKGEIPDYQMAAMMMAIYFMGMNDEETVCLTTAMAHSGDMLDLSAINGIKVDKHSTGGVGDKTSLVLGPMVASLGVPIAKMSGRGLGHTGGTIDKLESIKGFHTSLTTEQFIENVNRVKLAIMGQTADIAPADKKLYALRDVTATVDNMSLIASSIMSKKLAAGADAIVLDVKTGSGAFMKKEKDSRLLAKEMVKIGNSAGRKTVAVISDMDQPLGYAVGNAIEVREAIETLNGRGPADLEELCVTLGTQMLLCAGKAATEAEAEEMLKETIQNGAALKKFAEFVSAQGGDTDCIYHPEKLPQASIVKEVAALETGYIQKIFCEEIGVASLLLGGGRRKKEDEIDLSVGIMLRKKVGNFVNQGDSIATIYGNDPEKIKDAYNRIEDAYFYSQTAVKKKKFIKGIIKE
ncbi:MAG: pyrimidine-nucleoside phosphorylase [bacterium]|nr:pyrimidine-nucleoside phosphorylase [bacterium]